MLFKNNRIQKKLLLSFTGLFVIVIFLTLSAVGFAMYKARRGDLERQLGNITETAVELVLSQVHLIALDQLEQETVKLRSVLEYIYERGRENGASDEDIKEAARAYFSTPALTDSPSFYIIDGEGELLFRSYGEPALFPTAEYDYIREQFGGRTGFFEYQWGDPDKENFRGKVLYQSRFEPLGWSLAVSAFREELISPVKIDNFRSSLENITVGSEGYLFVMDRDGTFLIHPRFEGKNVNSIRLEGLDSSFLARIPEMEDGKFFYRWEDPASGKSIEKVLFFRHIPGLDWFIGSAVPLGEYFGYLRAFYAYVIVLFVLALLLFYLFSKKVSLLLIQPLSHIIDFMGSTSYLELADRLPVSGKDEFSQLSKGINDFLDAIEGEKNNRLMAEEENRILAQFTNGNPYPVMRIDGGGNILYVNKASKELMKCWGIAFSTRLPKNLIEKIRESGAELAEFEYKRKRRIYNILLSFFEAQNAYYLLILDITDKKKNEYQLIMSESVFSHTMEGIVITDPDGTIVRVNPAFSVISGYKEEDVLGKTPPIHLSDRQGEDFIKTMQDQLDQTGTWSGEVWSRRKNGDPFPEWLTINSICDDSGELIHYVGIFKDISDIKESEEKLRYQVSHDALTGLPNRILFEDRLNRAIARAERNGLSLAVLFLDMDNFKNINDSLGHQAGDEFLKIIAERLLQSCRDEDTVARLGGDEFVILIPEVTEQRNIIEVTNRIQTTLGKSLLFNAHELHPSVSIGVTVFPGDGDTPHMLMKNADLAMYRAKDLGKGTYSLFNKEMNRQVRKRMELESLLKKALHRNEMFLVYQPKISVASGAITGLEALLRWNNSKLGYISPADFIPLAEETGFIHVLGDWVLEKALLDLQELRRKTGRDLEMAVNLSVRQFRDSNLTDRIEEIITRVGIEPSLVNFEITEYAAMNDSEESLEIMSRLRKLGVRLSIDDFGTGYSSYSYLKRFQVHCLKIDKTFVDEVPHEEDTSAIMRNIIDLGHTLNMEVVAEGVEKKEQLDFLAGAGCNVVQGYYFYKPVEMEKLFDILTELVEPTA